MSFGEVLTATVIMLVAAVTVAVNAGAKEIEKIQFNDEITVSGTKLKLNGAGLRTKRRFGIGFRVYVAGLYLTRKTSDPNAIEADENLKYLRLVFLRSLDKHTIQEALAEGLKKNCKFECDKLESRIKAYNDLMVPLEDGSEIKMIIENDKVKVECDGKDKKAGTIDSAAFAKNVLAAYIGDEPPTPELKSALLGQ